MPRKRWIDKNHAQTFQLLYRSQNDPLLNDEAAGDRALFPVSGPAHPSTSPSPSPARALHIADLEDDVDFDSMRENEGEAAEYGIYFDDTSYDYMQHLRDLDDGSGEAHFLDAAAVKVKGKGKAKTMSLEDALRESSLEDEQSVEAPRSVLDGFSTFSRSSRQRTYQDQQDVPDEIAGFQPDMDPRLREVLEALEDEAYVDEKDEEDVFGALAKEGQMGELELEEFEATYEEDEGWESDVTEKAPSQAKELKLPVDEASRTPQSEETSEAGTQRDTSEAVAEDGDWLRDFAKYKRDAKEAAMRTGNSVAAPSAVNDQAATLYTLNGTPLRHKKRKGARTNPSAYSMTSSSLARTEGEQVLDARFDQIEKMYALNGEDDLDDDDGGMSLASGISKQSRMSALSTTSFADEGAVRGDFNSMMDDFLGGWAKGQPTGGKRPGAKVKRGKHGDELRGLQQLDEVRAELGPARVRRTQKA